MSILDASCLAINYPEDKRKINICTILLAARSLATNSVGYKSLNNILCLPDPFPMKRKLKGMVIIYSFLTALYGATIQIHHESETRAVIGCTKFATLCAAAFLNNKENQQFLSILQASVMAVNAE